jgi:hypothetical protein
MSYNPKRSGAEMSDRIKLIEAEKAWLSTLSQGKANPADIDSGTKIVDVDPKIITKLNSARAELAHTLSGGKPKQGFPANTLVSATDSVATTPDQARASLVKTMSAGRAPVAEIPIEESTVHYMTPSGHQIASTVTPGSILKLNQARRELRGTMANLEDATKIAMEKDQLVKTMKQNAFGIPNQTYDSGNTDTPSGVPHTPDHPITARGRTYAQLLAEESADKPTSVPTVASSQGADEDGNVEGDGDWSPSQAKADLIKAFTDSDGKIRKQQAQKWFLTVIGDGSNPDHYNVPLGTVSPVSQMVSYHPDALSEAFKHASGGYNSAVNRPLQNRIVRIAQRNKIPLTDSMQEHAIRHMAAESRYYGVDSSEEIDSEILKYDAEYQAAIIGLKKTLSGK